VNAKDAEHWTALLYACYSGLDNAVKFLCESTDAPLPADPRIRTKGGQTCFSVLKDQRESHKSGGDTADMIKDMERACTRVSRNVKPVASRTAVGSGVR
jgi:hypothetical protein